MQTDRLPKWFLVLHFAAKKSESNPQERVWTWIRPDAITTHIFFHNSIEILPVDLDPYTGLQHDRDMVKGWIRESEDEPPVKENRRGQFLPARGLGK